MGIDLDKFYGQVNRERILVIDDDPDTVYLLKEILRVAGYDVFSSTTALGAIKKCMDYKPDLVLLDLMMPEMDGWETFQHIRKISSVPIIFITAKIQKDDIVKGLQIGADDYITKPFHNAEVVARVQTVLRRSGSTKEIQRIVFPEIEFILDLNTQEVIFKGKPHHLPGREFQILVLLAKNSGELVKYEVIAKSIWGEEKPEVRKRIKYIVYLLRQKLEVDPDDPKLIQNIEGLGYKLQVH